MSSWKQIEAAKSVLSRETGTIYKDHGGKLTVALAYPNRYDVGMSSLALQILYRAWNSRPDVVCERVFWDEKALAAGAPLLSLESGMPAAVFEVWAFTVSFEMDYFNVVAMLRQAGIPPLAAQRQDDFRPAGPGQPRRMRHGDQRVWPLLIAGGPALSMNPEPLAPFFDAIVIGEAEELLPRLTDLLVDGIGGDRERLLDALDAPAGDLRAEPPRSQPGWQPPQIERLWVRDPEAMEPVSCLYTPDTEFPNRHLIEIARGCGRGCRFCLAGYVYRPPREQPLARILEWARAGLARPLPVFAHGGRTGSQPPGIGLVSAAVSDHSQIDELATELQGMGARITRQLDAHRPDQRAAGAGDGGERHANADHRARSRHRAAAHGDQQAADRGRSAGGGRAGPGAGFPAVEDLFHDRPSDRERMTTSRASSI